MFKDNYNEELEQKVKRLEEQLTEIRIVRKEGSVYTL